MKLFFTKNVALSLVLSTSLVAATATTVWASDAKSGATAADAKEAPKTVDVKDDTAAATISIDTAGTKTTEKITMGDLRSSYQNLPAQLQAQAPFNQFIANAKSYEALLDREISLKLITMKARAEGLDKKPEVQKKVAECQVAMVQKAFLDREIEKRLTDEKLKTKYEELKKLMPKNEQEIKIRFILVKTEDDAKKAVDRITKKGEDFAAVAKDVSLDITKDNGGSFDTWLRKADLQQLGLPVDDLMKAAKATNLTRPYKVGDKGWGLFRVDDKRPLTPPSFEEIKGELKAAVAPAEAPEVIAQELRNAKIERFGVDGKALPELKLDATAKEEKKEEAKAAPDAKTPEAKKDDASKGSDVKSPEAKAADVKKEDTAKAADTKTAEVK